MTTIAPVYADPCRAKQALPGASRWRYRNWRFRPPWPRRCETGIHGSGDAPVCRRRADDVRFGRRRWRNAAALPSATKTRDGMGLERGRLRCYHLLLHSVEDQENFPISDPQLQHRCFYFDALSLLRHRQYQAAATGRPRGGRSQRCRRRQRIIRHCMERSLHHGISQLIIVPAWPSAGCNSRSGDALPVAVALPFVAPGLTAPSLASCDDNAACRSSVSTDHQTANTAEFVADSRRRPRGPDASKRKADRAVTVAR